YKFPELSVQFVDDRLELRQGRGTVALSCIDSAWTVAETRLNPKEGTWVESVTTSYPVVEGGVCVRTTKQLERRIDGLHVAEGTEKIEVLSVLSSKQCNNLTTDLMDILMQASPPEPRRNRWLRAIFPDI